MTKACSKRRGGGLRWSLVLCILLMPAIFAADVATGYRFGLSDLYCIVALMTLRLAGPRPARALVSAGFLLILASVVDSHDPSALVHAAISIALLGAVSILSLRGAGADLSRESHGQSKAAVAGVPAPLLNELRQPLSVLLSDGRASLRWLKREQPDLPEALLCAQRIVANAARAGEMIAAIGRGAR